MSDDLRRKVAELLGWRMQATANRRPFHYWTLFNADDIPVWSALGKDASIDEAWEAAIRGDFVSGDVVPDWPHDPAAALGLLEARKLEWGCEYHSEDDEYIVWLCDEKGEGMWDALGTTFAEAATLAWCEWREAGE